MTIQHGSLIEQVAEAAREHATKSKKTDTQDKQGYMPTQSELPSVPLGSLQAFFFAYPLSLARGCKQMDFQREPFILCR